MTTTPTPSRTIADLPRLSGLPWLGSWPDAMRDPLALFSRAQAAGDMTCLRFGPYRYLVLHHPDAIHHVLVENPGAYAKSPSYRGLKMVLGEGLLTSEGDAWKRQRKLMQPAFHREHLARLADTMARDTLELVAEWEREGERELDVHDAMMRLTLRIVGHTLFSTELAGEADALAPLLESVNHRAKEIGYSPVPVPLWLPTPKMARFRGAIRQLDALVERIVPPRRALGADAPHDLLSMLLAARDEETGEGMDDRTLRDEVLTLVLAGHETTANGLSWTFSLLARHPDVCARVAQEAHAVLGDRAPALADLPRLALARRVVEESLRLYPPAWGFERIAVADDVIDGVAVPKGTFIGIIPYTLHRDARWYPDPEVFDPDRFLPDRVAARPRHAYLPFGGGPRVCIGMAFALMETQLVLATIARRFRLELAPGARLRLDPAVTLRPGGGLRMVRRRRDAVPQARTTPTASRTV